MSDGMQEIGVIEPESPSGNLPAKKNSTSCGSPLIRFAVIKTLSDSPWFIMIFPLFEREKVNGEGEGVDVDEAKTNFSFS